MIKKDQVKEQPKEQTDEEYLEAEINKLISLHRNFFKDVQEISKLIKEIKADRKVCKCKNVLSGINALLENFAKKKQEGNNHIKNIRTDLKHFSSLLKVVKGGDHRK